MKTIIKTVLCAAALSVSTLSFAKEKNSKDKESIKPTATFNASVYITKDASIRVAVEKNTPSNVVINLRDARNEVVYSDEINRKELKSVYKLDVEQLKDGDYTLEIISNTKTVTKSLHLALAKVERSVVVE